MTTRSPVGIPASTFLTLSGLYMLLPCSAAAGDWPQWLGGPRRNGTNHAPEAPRTMDPRVRWRKQFGSGYSSVSTSGGTGLTMGSVDGDDVLTAFSIASGKTLWTHRSAPRFTGKDGADDGPRSTPAVDGSLVFALSARGVLHAVHLDSGKPAWTRDLVKAYGARSRYFGFATSLLLIGPCVIVAAGGSDGRSLLCFDKNTGALVWSAESDFVEYGSPAAMQAAGAQQVVMISDEGVFSVRAADGVRLWSIAGKTDSWATPLPVPGDRVFLPHPRRFMLVKITHDGDKWEARPLWSRSDLHPYSSFFALRNGHIYGTTKRNIICIDATTGEDRWNTPTGRHSGVLYGDQFIVLENATGEMRIFLATPEAYWEQAVFGAFRPADHRTPPSTIGSTVFLRNSSEVIALDVGPLR